MREENTDIKLSHFTKRVSVRSSHRRCSVNGAFLKKFANFSRKNLCWSFFLIKLLWLLCCCLLKRDPNIQGFSCEIYEINEPKVSLFNKVVGLRPATLLKRDSNTAVFLWSLRNFQECLFWRKFMNDCFYYAPLY